MVGAGFEADGFHFAMFDSLSTRLQDVFKTLAGQGRLTPENIEAALREIRLALLEADVNFKVVKAFIVRSDPTLSEQDISDHCRSYLSAYKQPRQIEFRDELPKTTVGKILRRALR